MYLAWELSFRVVVSRPVSGEYTEIRMYAQLGSDQKKTPKFGVPTRFASDSNLLYNEYLRGQVQAILYSTFSKALVRFVTVVVIIYR